MSFLFRAATGAIIAFAPLVTASNAACAQQGYELTMITPSTAGSMAAYRLNVATGQVSNVSGSTSSEVQEPQNIPAGQYRLYSVQTLDKVSYWLYRLETQTGRTWFLSNNSWTEVTQGK